MQLFYCTDIEESKAVLNADESRHCKVLRKSVGDKIDIIDGLGNLYHCTLVAYAAKGVELKVDAKMAMPSARTHNLHLFIAPTKQNDRIEWMFEKAVEAGLDSIHFIITEHSEKPKYKTDRLEKIAISALKQSGQYTLPIIHQPIPLGEIQLKGLALFAHCREDRDKRPLKDALLDRESHNDISFLIGPEGDFSMQELALLRQMKAIPVSLGNTRLRTETAGLYCCMAASALL